MKLLVLFICFTFLGCAFSLAVEHAEHAAVTIKRRNIRQFDTEKLQKLEKRLDILEGILLELDIPLNAKDMIKPLSNKKYIESKVEKNKEDIKDLENTDDRHVFEAFEVSKYIKNTIKPSLEEKVEKKIDEQELYDDYSTSEKLNDNYTRPPIGSIVAWVPAYSAKQELQVGWQRCDGDEITKGPFKGNLTPDLNKAKRFLRGGSDELAGTFEDDSVQEHEHEDPGHSHMDTGHSHSDAGHSHYEDSGGAGHWSAFFGSDKPNSEDVFCSDNQNSWSCGGYYMHANSWTTENGTSAIQKSQANIQVNFAGLGGVKSGRVGAETRPKNMKVVYILRIL